MRGMDGPAICGSAAVLVAETAVAVAGVLGGWTGTS